MKDNKIVTMADFHKEQHRREFKAKVEAKLQSGKEWFEQHKEAVVVLAPVVIGGLTSIIKQAAKRSNLNKQEQRKDKYCYDRSLGHYWKLRRDLTNKEWLEIDKRKANGERLSDILADMRVLH